MEKFVWFVLAKRKRDGQTNNRNKHGHSMGTEQCQCIKSIYCSANILFKINDINSIENRKQQWLVHWMHNGNRNSNKKKNAVRHGSRQWATPKWKQSKSHFISIFTFYLLKLVASIACRYVWTCWSQFELISFFFWLNELYLKSRKMCAFFLLLVNFSYN